MAVKRRRRRSKAYTKSRTVAIRVDSEFVNLIKFIQAQHLLREQRSPSIKSLTKQIARLIKNKNLVRELTP